MPTDGESSVPKKKGTERKQRAERGQVGKKAYRKRGGAGKMTAGEGVSSAVFFLQGGDALLVRARSVNGKSREGDDDETQSGGEEEGDERFCGEVLKKDNVRPQKEVSERKEGGQVCVEQQNCLLQALSFLQKSRVFFVKLLIIVLHNSSIAYFQGKVNEIAVFCERRSSVILRGRLSSYNKESPRRGNSKGSRLFRGRGVNPSSTLR